LNVFVYGARTKHEETQETRNKVNDIASYFLSEKRKKNQFEYIKSGLFSFFLFK